MKKYSSGYALMDIMGALGVLVIVCSVGLGIFIFAMNDRLSEFVGITAIIYGGFSGLVLMGMGAIGGAILDGSVSQQNTEREIARLVEEMRNSKNDGSYQYSYVKNNDIIAEEIKQEEPLVENYKGYEIIKNSSTCYIKGIVDPDNFRSIEAAQRWIDVQLQFKRD